MPDRSTAGRPRIAAGTGYFLEAPAARPGAKGAARPRELVLAATVHERPQEYRLAKKSKKRRR